MLLCQVLDMVWLYIENCAQDMEWQFIDKLSPFDTGHKRKQAIMLPCMNTNFAAAVLRLPESSALNRIN